MNANLKVKDFKILYLSCVEKLAIPEINCEFLLEFIRLILPTDNKLPTSHYKIKKSINATEIIQYNLCSICERVLVDKQCPSETCFSQSTTIKKNIKIYTANITTQLQIILNFHTDSMKRYISKH